MSIVVCCGHLQQPYHRTQLSGWESSTGLSTLMISNSQLSMVLGVPPVLLQLGLFQLDSRHELALVSSHLLAIAVAVSPFYNTNERVR